MAPSPPMAVPGRWAGLHAALLLAVGRIDGAVPLLAEAPGTQAARAWHAFLALPASLPLFLLVQFLALPPGAADVPRLLASFVLGWLGYALLSERMAAGSGRAALWPRFIMLWNWCNLVQYLLLAAALLQQLLGVPAMLAQGAWLVAICWALWLQWSATRLGLALGGGPAALLVTADLAMGLLMGRLTGG